MKFLKNPSVLLGIVVAVGTIALAAAGVISPRGVVWASFAVLVVGLMAAIFAISLHKPGAKIGCKVVAFCAAYLVVHILAGLGFGVYYAFFSPHAQAVRQTYIAQQETARKSRTLLGPAEEEQKLIFTVKDVPELVGNTPNGHLYAFRGIHPDLSERLVFLDVSEIASPTGGCRMPKSGDKVEVVLKKFRANDWWQAPVGVQQPFNSIFLAQPCQ
jgi:hypothetical protein